MVVGCKVFVLQVGDVFSFDKFVEVQFVQVKIDFVVNCQDVVFCYVQNGVQVIKIIILYFCNFKVDVWIEVRNGLVQVNMLFFGFGKVDNFCVQVVLVGGQFVSVQGSGILSVQNIQYVVL